MIALMFLVKSSNKCFIGTSKPMLPEMRNCIPQKLQRYSYN
jgi:hypothetical protein